MDEQQPATKGDIARLEQRIVSVDGRMDELESKSDGLGSRFDKLESRFDSLESKFESAKEELKHYFKVVVEELHHDLLGARTDEVELLKDKSENHEQRIVKLERFNGLPVG